MLNAILCVWNEEDIIETTVKHAFAQGCSNVFIVDNASTDNTVQKAIHAGAILADSFESQFFDEDLKITYLNNAVMNFNNKCDEEHVWWLYIDADEFPTIEYNLTIAEFLKSLGPTIRAVHGHMFQHIPTHPPYHMPGCHPADFMQVATKSDTTKIPLLRYDKGKPHIFSGGGAHTVDTRGESIHMVDDILNIHHFNYRRPENTIARLNRLCERRQDGSSRLDVMDFRAENKESHYHRCLKNAQTLYAGYKDRILMTDDLGYNYPSLVRWYDIHTFPVVHNEDPYDILFAQAMHLYYLQQFDLALCRLHDLLEITDDIRIKLLITVKIALCMATSSKVDAVHILKPVLRCKYNEIREYAIAQMIRIDRGVVQSCTKTKTIDVTIRDLFGKSRYNKFAP